MADPADGAISDPKKIRALAHPIRLALLEVLSGYGTLTATRCAELIGQSVASCSFHLRSLAQHGYITRAPGEGRERPWRLVSATQRLRRSLDDEASMSAAEAFDEFFLAHEFRRLQSWWARRSADPADEAWYEASIMTGATAWLTLEELAEIEAELLQYVLRRFVDRGERPAEGPATRPVRLLLASSVGLPELDGG